MMSINNRDHRITVRLNVDEYKQVEKKAMKARISISTFLRNSGLDYNIKTPLTDDEKIIYRQLTGMANNLNQLARNSHKQSLFSLSAVLNNTLNEINSVIKLIKP